MWFRNSQATIRQGIIVLFPALPDHGGGEQVDAPLDHADVVRLGERGELDVGAEQLEGPPVVDEGTLLRVAEHWRKRNRLLGIDNSRFCQEFHMNRGLPLTHKDLLAQEHVAVEFSVLPLAKLQHRHKHVSS